MASAYRMKIVSLFARSFLFDRTQQRILSRLRDIHRLFRFHRGDLIRVDAGDADASGVDGKHDGEGFGFGEGEDVLENEDDKFHRRKVVIVQQNLEKLWLFELCTFFDEYTSAAVNIWKVGHRENYRLESSFLLNFSCAVYLVFNLFAFSGHRFERRDALVVFVSYSLDEERSDLK